MKKTVLVVGSGGREHALAWKLSQSSKVSRLIIVPGNDGMSSQWERWNLPISTRADFAALAERARAEKVDLAVIGPDNQLADGIVDVLEDAGILCFGPRAAAAKIEASKAFAKDIMHAAGVPTARFEVFESAPAAREFLKSVEWGSGWVIKADGLAFGKGVYVCESRDEALAAIDSLQALGSSAKKLVIEERLQGEEISWFAFSDGENCALLEPARDHKRIFDQNQGPNTGGMGAFSPVPGVPVGFAERVKYEVFLPTLAEMKRRGVPFKGVLFAGLMVDFSRNKLWVLEFNCRFGDPETQVVLARMDDDLYDWCEAVAKGELSKRDGDVKFSPESAVIIVAAARGYPEKPEKGAVISAARLEAPEYFCAGVTRKPGSKELQTSGGRVLGAVGTGPSLRDARDQAYQRIRRVQFEGMHFRSDIGVMRPQS
ncbi:MAG: phosphoribosylamine--glycine ligase [Bdellovibrionia bacterium]